MQQNTLVYPLLKSSTTDVKVQRHRLLLRPDGAWIGVERLANCVAGHILKLGIDDDAVVSFGPRPMGQEAPPGTVRFNCSAQDFSIWVFKRDQTPDRPAVHNAIKGKAERSMGAGFRPFLAVPSYIDIANFGR